MQIETVRAEALLDLRARVLFPGEGRSHARMKRDHDLTSTHWSLTIDGQMRGCVSVMRYRGWMLRGMAVDIPWQGQGLGMALIRRVEQDMARPLWCNARGPAVGFYARAGWLPRGPEFLQEGEPHQRFEWPGPPET